MNYIMVLDTETTNDLIDNIAYDIGYIVADEKENIIVQRSFMVSEIFFDYKELLDSAFYKEKLPEYWTEYNKGKRKIASIFTIARIIKKDIKQYNIKDVFAYNADFDRRALNKTIRYISKSKYRWFMPFGVSFKCIWHIACQTLYTHNDFFQFAIMQNKFSASGNIQTSAEVGYQFITQNYNFAEEHKGIDDVKIEYKILIECLKFGIPIDYNINRLCWRIPQKFYKNLQNRA